MGEEMSRCTLHFEKDINKKYEYFKKHHEIFPENRYYNLDNYCDIYLEHFGTRYRKYLYPFCELLKLRGIYFGTTCYIEELLWNKIKTGNYTKFIPKRKGDLNLMSGIQFEIFLSKFFTRCGYNVNRTPATNDSGADLIMTKGYTKYVVQAKRHKKTIGAKEVRDVYAAKTIYHANNAIVVTTSKFSKQAIKTANELHIELWDGNYLKNELKLYNYQY